MSIQSLQAQIIANNPQINATRAMQLASILAGNGVTDLSQVSAKVGPEQITQLPAVDISDGVTSPAQEQRWNPVDFLVNGKRVNYLGNYGNSGAWEPGSVDEARKQSLMSGLDDIKIGWSAEGGGNADFRYNPKTGKFSVVEQKTGWNKYKDILKPIGFVAGGGMLANAAAGALGAGASGAGGAAGGAAGAGTGAGGMFSGIGLGGDPLLASMIPAEWGAAGTALTGGTLGGMELAGGGGLLGSLGGLAKDYLTGPGVLGNLAKLGLIGAGAYAGSQQQPGAQSTSTQKLDPRMDQMLYGGLLPQAQEWFNANKTPNAAMQKGWDMQMGLLSNPQIQAQLSQVMNRPPVQVAGNPYLSGSNWKL